MKSGKRAGLAHRHRFLFGALGAAVLILLGASIGVGILLSGGVSTAATTQHFAITHRLLDFGLRFSVNARADEIEAPDLNDVERQERGMACYRRHCERCHGGPGIAPGEESRGMLPIPANLSHSDREWSPAALYYITKKGVRMTGMPAWEFRLSERSLWDTVAFLTTLATQSETSYRQLRAASEAAVCESNTLSPARTTRERGDVLLRQYACHSCHRIDGVIGPRTYVAPALIDWPKRKYIAGVVPNTQANLELWIQDPKAVDPSTLMPNLAVPAAHAREMAIFLMESR